MVTTGERRGEGINSELEINRYNLLPTKHMINKERHPQREVESTLRLTAKSLNLCRHMHIYNTKNSIHLHIYMYFNLTPKKIK